MNGNDLWTLYTAEEVLDVLKYMKIDISPRLDSRTMYEADKNLQEPWL